MKNVLITTILSFSFSLGFAQNGKILSKELIDLKTSEYWYKLSENDTLKAEYKYLNKLDFYEITYQSDSSIVKGMILEPKKEGLYPAVIFNRGGNTDAGKLDAYLLIVFTSKLAEQGYVIVGTNYRDEEEYGGEDINDVLYLTETLKEIKKADTSRIGMFGWSRGGMMTYLALKKSDNIKTAIVGNGPSDLFAIAEYRPFLEENVFARYIPNYWENKEAELKKRSVLYWADELNKNSSLLILCGTKDRSCPQEQSDKISHLLEQLAYDYQLKKYETDHLFSDKRDELNEEIINWLNSRL
ncbi:MAG: prolyl oligopeptidase family serine peptidase [Flavobacteriales bacterium]